MKILNGTSMLVNFAQNNHISSLNEAHDYIPLDVLTTNNNLLISYPVSV